MAFNLQLGGKFGRSQELTQVSDWDERTQATTLQVERGGG
ncbi:addiction module toxin RelE [Serratia marcescens]|nr:addiction module toxin RelE [Serratia marcescens]